MALGTDVLQVCQELLDSREQMSPFIDGDYDEYVAEMADVQTWGGEPELALAAEVLQLPVSVYQREQVLLRPLALRLWQAEQWPSALLYPSLMRYSPSPTARYAVQMRICPESATQASAVGNRHQAPRPQANAAYCRDYFMRNV